jgi:hypothetical protein
MWEGLAPHAKSHIPYVESPPVQAFSAALADRRRPPEAVLEHLHAAAEAIVGVANGEPKTVLDAIEAGAERLGRVRLHQMLPLRTRRYIEGAYPGLRHVSWFLSATNREAFHNRHSATWCPTTSARVPQLMRRATRAGVVLAAAAPPDRHGCSSLGVSGDYLAAIDRPPDPSSRPRLPLASRSSLTFSTDYTDEFGLNHTDTAIEFL